MLTDWMICAKSIRESVLLNTNYMKVIMSVLNTSHMTNIVYCKIKVNCFVSVIVKPNFDNNIIIVLLLSAFI